MVTGQLDSSETSDSAVSAPFANFDLWGCVIKLNLDGYKLVAITLRVSLVAFSFTFTSQDDISFFLLRQVRYAWILEIKYSSYVHYFRTSSCNCDRFTCRRHKLSRRWCTPLSTLVRLTDSGENYSFRLWITFFWFLRHSFSLLPKLDYFGVGLQDTCLSSDLNPLSLHLVVFRYAS